MYYTRLVVSCSPDFGEMLMAELAEIGFDTFMEQETGFEAYSEQETFNQQEVEALIARYATQTNIRFSFDRVEKKNWNEEWEKNYEPIIVDDRCLIRAHFHQIPKKYPYEIVITPKMSFGTGHHQTTYLMVRAQLDLDHKGKRVMDAGCGTAILSIMACKRGASNVEAFDIDAWSVINGQENIDVNGCTNIRIQQGKIAEMKFDGAFDIILANINRNVLLDEMRAYSSYLKNNGNLLLSGFYTHDIPAMIEAANKHGFIEVRRDEREGWASLLLSKK